MKKVIKLSFALLLTVAFLTSCNKEKMAVKKLDGSWELKSFTASHEDVDCGGTASEETVVWEFTSYSVGDEESGDLKVTVTVDGNNFVTNSTYEVDEKAETIKVTTELGGKTDVTELEIVKLTKKEVEIKQVDTVSILVDCNGTYEDKEVTTTAVLEKK